MNSLTTDARDSLEAIQARMQACVLAADISRDAALDDVQASDAFGAARRLGIYHHAYRARLLETLRDTFAHTLSYLGDAWFDHLAQAYIAQHPSRHANLRWYGETWPDWLDGDRLASAGAGPHPEVAELARLDWALRRAFDAPDMPALCAEDLLARTPDQWVTLPLVAQPSLALLSMGCNTLALWHALDQGGDVPLAEVLPDPVSVLVWRHEERPHFRSVSEAEAQALTQLMLGGSFASICDMLAQGSEPSGEDARATDVAAGILRGWLREGLLGPFVASRASVA